MMGQIKYVKFISINIYIIFLSDILISIYYCYSKVYFGWQMEY